MEYFKPRLRYVREFVVSHLLAVQRKAILLTTRYFRPPKDDSLPRKSAPRSPFTQQTEIGGIKTQNCFVKGIAPIVQCIVHSVIGHGHNHKSVENDIRRSAFRERNG